MMDTKLAIVSSGLEEIMKYIMGPELCSEFEFILGRETHTSKEEKIKMINKSWQAPIDEIYYFTDTLSDYLELRDFLEPKRIIGCSWGWMGYTPLKLEMSKKQILRKPQDFKKIFKDDLINLKTDQELSLDRIWDSVDESILQRDLEVPKAELRKLFNYLMKQKPPKKLRNRKKAVVYDLIQTKTNPPIFELFVKSSKTIHWSYMRFLENTLRRNFGFNNTQIVVKMTEIDKGNVY